MSKTKNAMTGRKAMSLNRQVDGIKIRSAAFKNKAKYDRTADKRKWKQEA